MRHLTLSTTVGPNEAYHISRNRMIRSSAYPMHSHDFCEIFFIEEGSGVHRINGKRMPLEAGTLVMIRSADSHGFSVIDDAGFVVANLAFAASTMDFIRKRYFPKDDLFFGGKGKMPRVLQVPESMRQWLSVSFTGLAASARTPFALERFLLNLFHELSIMQEQPLSGCPEWLVKAIGALRDPEHFSGGTPAFARLCGHSPEHVSREVRRCLGCTPTDVVNRARLDWAAGQLCLTSKKISSIAFECGFENLGHFYSLFAGKFQTTPRTYRLRNSAVYR